MRRTRVVVGCFALLFWSPAPKGQAAKSQEGGPRTRFFPPSPFGNILFPRWNSPSEEDERPLAWRQVTFVPVSVRWSGEALKANSFVPGGHRETPQPPGEDRDPWKHLSNGLPHSGLVDLDSVLRVSQDVLTEALNLAKSTSKEYAKDFGEGVTSKKDFDVLDQLIDRIQVSSEILNSSTTSLRDFPRQLKQLSTELHNIFEKFYGLVSLTNDSKAFSGVCHKVVTSVYIIDRCYEELRQISLKISILAKKMSKESNLAQFLMKSYAKKDLEEVFLFGQLREILFELGRIQKDVIKLLRKQSRVSRLLNQEAELLRENYGQLRHILNGSRSQINRRITLISNLMDKIENISVLSLDLLDIKKYHFYNKSKKEFPHLKNKPFFQNKINRSLCGLSFLKNTICAKPNRWKCKEKDCLTYSSVKEYDITLPTYDLDHVKHLPDSTLSPFVNQEDESTPLTTLDLNTELSPPKVVDQMGLPHLTTATNPTFSIIPPSNVYLYFSTRYNQYPRMTQVTSITPQSNLNEHPYQELHYDQIHKNIMQDSTLVYSGNMPQSNNSTSYLETTNITLNIGESINQISTQSKNTSPIFNYSSPGDKNFEFISTTEATVIQTSGFGVSKENDTISEQSGTHTLTSVKDISLTSLGPSVIQSNDILQTNLPPDLHHKLDSFIQSNSNYDSSDWLMDDYGPKQPLSGNLSSLQIRGRGFMNAITNASSAREIQSLLSNVSTVDAYFTTNISTIDTPNSPKEMKDGSLPNFKKSYTELMIDSTPQNGSTSNFNPQYQMLLTTDSSPVGNSSRAEPTAVNKTPLFESQSQYEMEHTNYNKLPLDSIANPSTPSFMLKPNHKESVRIQFIPPTNNHTTSHSSEFLEAATITPTSSIIYDSVKSKVFIPLFQGTSGTSIGINNTVYKTQMFNLWSNQQPKETITINSPLLSPTQTKRDDDHNKTLEKQEQNMEDIENDYEYFESYRKYAKEFSLEDLEDIDIQDILGLELNFTMPQIYSPDLSYLGQDASEEEKLDKFDSISYQTTISEDGDCDKTEAIMGPCKITMHHHRRLTETDWNVSLICPCTMPSYEGTCPLRIHKGTEYIINICRVAVSD